MQFQKTAILRLYNFWMCGAATEFLVMTQSSLSIIIISTVQDNSSTGSRMSSTTTSTAMMRPVPGNNEKADGQPYLSGPGAVGCLGSSTTTVGKGSSQLDTLICLPSEQDKHHSKKSTSSSKKATDYMQAFLNRFLFDGSRRCPHSRTL